VNKDEIAMDYKKELKKRISADYERRVKQWMAADPSQLIDAAEEITAESKFADLGIDSLDVTEILMKLEDEFGVTLEMDPSITSVGDLISKIEEQQK